MIICSFIFVLLALRTTNGLYSSELINGSNQSNTSEINVPNAGNGGDEFQTIFLKKPSLKEICVILNVSDIECTCENFQDFCQQPARIFVCSRYWDKIEGTISITVSVIGVLGNTLVLVISLINWKSSRRFRKLAALLALADLIFAIVEIITAAQLFKTCKWLYKTFFCKFSKGAINIGGIFALSLIAIIALERYLAIVKPFRRSKLQLSFWVWPFLALLFSIISVIPLFIVYEVSTDGICVEKWPQGSNGSLIYSCYLLIGTFIIPMGIISYFYYCVVKKVWGNARNLQTTGNGKQILGKRERSNKRVMVILLAIAGAFFVLVFPNRIICVILDITGTNNMTNTTYRMWKYTALFPYFFHVSVNPIIYSFIDKRFQQQVLGLFKVKGKGPFKKSISSVQSTKHMTAGTARNKGLSTTTSEM